MLRIAPKAITYCGWQIKVVMCNRNFVFQCYPPGRYTYSNDGYEYANFRSALVAARQFIDREIAVIAISATAKDWLERGVISESEYWNLTAFD